MYVVIEEERSKEASSRTINSLIYNSSSLRQDGHGKNFTCYLQAAVAARGSQIAARSYATASLQSNTARHGTWTNMNGPEHGWHMHIATLDSGHRLYHNPHVMRNSAIDIKVAAILFSFETVNDCYCFFYRYVTARHVTQMHRAICHLPFVIWYLLRCLNVKRHNIDGYVLSIIEACPKIKEIMPFFCNRESSQAYQHNITKTVILTLNSAHIVFHVLPSLDFLNLFILKKISFIETWNIRIPIDNISANNCDSLLLVLSLNRKEKNNSKQNGGIKIKNK